MTIKDSLRLSLIATAVMVTANAASEIDGDDLPPAKPGQCFTKAFFPAKYTTTTERVLASEASEKIQTIPAKYGYTTEKIKVSDGTQRMITSPATYKTVYSKVMSKPAQQTWRTSLSNTAPEASHTCVQSAESAGMNISGSRPGTCFYEHYRPEKYQTTSSKVLASEASERVVAVPAKYRTITKKILISNGTEKLVKNPVQYKNVRQKVQIAPARTEWKKTKCQDRGCNQSEVVCLIEIPATYKTVTKRVVAKPATTRKVTTPPVYKTVRIQELVAPATSRTIPIPATYKTVTNRKKIQNGEYSWTDASGKNARTRATNQCNRICLTAKPAQYSKVSKKVVAKPATTRMVTTPAKYTTVKIKNIVQPASERRVAIPATYKTVTKKRKVAEGYAKWVPIVCKSNMTTTTIRKVQEALKSAGFYNGSIDGVWGGSSRSATRAYQKAKGLPIAGLSVATMQSLGVY
jgi:peptidoglycan hydrolase-like protein with peptidoglycan-binding domain